MVSPKGKVRAVCETIAGKAVGFYGIKIRKIRGFVGFVPPWAMASGGGGLCSHIILFH